MNLLVQCLDIGVAQRPGGKPAGEVDRGPKLRDRAIEARNRRLLGEVAGYGQRDFLIIA